MSEPVKHYYFIQYKLDTLFDFYYSLTGSILLIMSIINLGSQNSVYIKGPVTALCITIRLNHISLDGVYSYGALGNSLFRLINYLERSVSFYGYGNKFFNHSITPMDAGFLQLFQYTPSFPHFPDT